MSAAVDPSAPRVFYSSRRRTIALLAIAVFFTLAGVLMMLSGEDWAWAVLAFGVVCTVVFVIILLRPNRLELSPRGLTTVTLGRRWSVEWSQCGDFRTWRNDIQLGSPAMIVFDCRAASNPVLELGAVALTGGANAALPETYGMPAADLAEILNAYRAAHTQPGM